jgi:hypothetical protein
LDRLKRLHVGEDARERKVERREGRGASSRE